MGKVYDSINKEQMMKKFVTNPKPKMQAGGVVKPDVHTEHFPQLLHSVLVKILSNSLDLFGIIIYLLLN
jgi:hypothetical protein